MTNDDFKSWRKRVGLTQAECGKVLGYSQQHICLLESGKFPIPPAVALATIGYEFREKANDFREMLAFAGRDYPGLVEDPQSQLTPMECHELAKPDDDISQMPDEPFPYSIKRGFFS